ncbi:hypothetical protein OD91_0743 [Lutibacter sp. Hel_I_33_5]|uniref:SGNH/GDSL hydrolase family protein n=1 Tax=Lutibacter sp. Hel_I_33_5 TaxID=1566289 RepID=UPI0011A8AF92|nr:SGNH/GDSL hydrolase family protein [Lutibacter sp. Hel_I_33_5]TVZ55495.1 hypothetical protein OD91_0743 [Lutibacter sp. Hel_I_33_5]
MIDDYGLFFGVGKAQLNNEFRIVSYDDKFLEKEFEYLIFTDSKGSGEENYFTWTDQFIDRLKINKISFLLITRPKEMTIFFSLINFLNNNDLKFKNLITNIGFVDTTPKKKEFIDDIFHQNPFKNKLIEIPLCNYLLNSGKVTTLYSVNYDSVICDIVEILTESFEKIHLIGTFEFSKYIKIDRKRPIEFYEQLKQSNEFLRKIQSKSININYIDVNRYLAKEDESDISYDAVHFTQEGHNIVMSICMNEIQLSC